MADPFRGTGRTTRMLWRALLSASETDNAKVLVVVAHHQMALYALDLLARLTQPIGGVQYHGMERWLRLPNGSEIRIEAAARAESHWRAGRRWTKTFYDHHMPLPAARIDTEPGRGTPGGGT